MKFRTEYVPTPGEFPLLSPQQPLLLLGSCFSDNMGERLQRVAWQAVSNPCGVLYNPASIAATLCHALDSRYVPMLHKHPLSELWFSYDFSTKFADSDPDRALRQMTDAIENLRRALHTAQALFVTFGTAWIFELADGGQTVANCHKMHPDTFLRRQLGVAECMEIWQPLIMRIKELNPKLEVLFTVSPVRHLADGMAGNARSKARLLLLCEQLAAMPGCYYFPAFEIVNDDLRDYRFYAEDLAHPAAVAVDYLFEKFTQAFLLPSELPRLAAAAKNWRRTLHREIRDKR